MHHKREMLSLNKDWQVGPGCIFLLNWHRCSNLLVVCRATASARRHSIMALANLFQRKTLDRLVGETADPRHRLKRVLGPVQLTMLGVGAIVGAAYARNPRRLSASNGDSSPIWLFCRPAGSPTMNMLMPGKS